MRGRAVDLGSQALLLKGISAWLEAPNLGLVSALLGVGAALRAEGLRVHHPAAEWSTRCQRLMRLMNYAIKTQLKATKASY